MKYIKTYKMFEGVYQDTKNTIMDLDDQILSVSEDYQKEVSDCFSELTDKYKTHTKWEGTEDSLSEYMSSVYEFTININQYFEFFEDYEDSYEKLGGYIGKIPRMIIYYNGPNSRPPNEDVQIFQTSYSMDKWDYSKLKNYMDREMKMKFINVRVWDVVNNKFVDYIDRSVKLKIKFILN